MCPTNYRRVMQMLQTARYFDDETIYVGICVALRQWVVSQAQYDREWTALDVDGRRLIGGCEEIEAAEREREREREREN